MIDYHLIGPLPVPEEYPSWQPVAKSATHWAGMIRLNADDLCPIQNCEILAAIETNGESTWDAMLSSLSLEKMAALRAIHPEYIAVLDENDQSILVATGQIVNMA